MNWHSSWRRAGLLLTSAAMVLAACSGGETADTAAETTAAPPTTSASGTTADASGGDTSAPPGADAPELGGTSWNVTFHTIGSGMTNLWPGTEITLAFGTDGTFSGNAGCNDYRGTFTVEGGYDEFEDGIRDPADGQVLRLDGLSFTEIGCTSPNNVMEQEQEYLAVLGDVGRWVIVRGSLSLRDAEGFFLIEAEPLA
jgi:heat shock protein HslJ